MPVVILIIGLFVAFFLTVKEHDAKECKNAYAESGKSAEEYSCDVNGNRIQLRKIKTPKRTVEVIE